MIRHKRILILMALLLCAVTAVFGQCATVTITATNNGVICGGNSVNLTATTTDGTAPFSYSWSDGETTPAITVNKAGTYTVTVSDNTPGCQPVVRSYTVTAETGPAAPTTGNVTICKGSTATLIATSATPGATFNWYDANGFLASGSSYTTGAISAPSNYYVEALTAGGCAGPKATVLVFLTADPVTTGAAACAGTPATVTATGGDSYTWYTAPNGTAVGTGASYTAILTTTTTFYVVAVTNGCTSSPIPATITVTPSPKTPVPNAVPAICSGSYANLHATVTDGGTVAWYDTPTGGAPLISSPDYTTPALSVTTTYYVQNTLGQCQSARIPVTVNVTTSPADPVVPATSACNGTSAIITIPPATGITYAWYADAGGASPLPNNTANPFTTPLLTATTTYYVRAINGSCTSNLVPVTITVLPTPSQPSVIVPPGQVCPNTGVTLAINAPNGTYNWYNTATGGTSLFTGDTYTPTVTANTTYYVDVTNTNGCTSMRTAVPVSVLPAVTPPTVSSANICYNNAATLTATGSDNYQWYDQATGGTQISTGDTFTTGPLSATTTYYVQTIVNGCNSARTAVTVTVNPVPPAPTVSVPGTTICPGTAATLTATGTGTIHWYNVATGGTALATGNTYTPTVNSTTTFYAENVVGSCASARAAVTINTVAITFPQFQYTSATICTTAGTVTPTISDPAGGTFTASPAGLVFTNNTLGTIDVASTTPGKYTITFTGNEACHSQTKTLISIVTNPDATFTYAASPYCQYSSTNATPTFTGLASAGTFSEPSGNIVFTDATTGVIDLQKSLPGTYTIKNTIPATGTCPVTSATAQVTISPSAIVSAGADQTVNSGSTVQLAGAIIGTQGGKWTGGGGTFSNPTADRPIYTPAAGETSVTLTFTSTASAPCGVPSDQVVITIQTPPGVPVVANNNVAVCAGSSTVVSATSPSGGTLEWFNVAAGGTKLYTGANYTTPAITTPITYYVQANKNGNISARVAVNVTVNALPGLPVAPATQTCYNTPATLTVQNPDPTQTYEWYASATSTVKLPGGGISYTTPNLTSNASYYVQAVNSTGCVSARTKVDVTVVVPPVVTSAAVGQICSGSAAVYTITADNPSATYSWSRPLIAGISNAAATGATNTINETLFNTSAAPVKVTYTITATANSCSTVFSYVLTVNPFGTVTSAPTGTICDSTQVGYQFQFSHPVTFKWSRAAVAGIDNAPVTDQAAPIINESLFNITNAPIDVTYTFNYTETNGGCGSSFSYVVTVNPAVKVISPFYINACTNTPLGYQIMSNIPSATFTWSRAATPGISNPAVSGNTSSIINETLINTSTDVAYATYRITPSAYNCTGTPFLFVVGVNSTPAQPAVSSNSPVCVAKDLDLFLLSDPIPGATYSWTGPNGFTSTQQNPVISNVTTASAGTYTLVVTVKGCPGPPASTVVQVNPLPKATAGTDQVVCVTQNAVNITGVITGGTTTGVWTTSGTGSFSPSAVQLNTQYIPSAQDKTNGSVILTLTSTSKDDCTPATATTTITFAPTPAVDAGPDQQVCSQTAAVPLNGKLIKPGGATWTTSGSGSFSPSAGQLNASYLPSTADATAGSVILTLHYNGANAQCDIPSDDMVLKLLPPPMVNAGGTRYVLKDHTITLEPSVSDNNVQYLWTPSSGLNDNTVKNPVVTGGNYDQLYTLTVTDSRGCSSQDQALVKVSPVITINNTFTPNGDGINDQWSITGLVAYVDATVDVYNRNGTPLYHSLGYDKPWDGTYNGQQLPVGTYYYIIHLHVKDQVLSGSVTIIR